MSVRSFSLCFLHWMRIFDFGQHLLKIPKALNGLLTPISLSECSEHKIKNKIKFRWDNHNVNHWYLALGSLMPWMLMSITVFKHSVCYRQSMANTIVYLSSFYSSNYFQCSPCVCRSHWGRPLSQLDIWASHLLSLKPGIHQTDFWPSKPIIGHSALSGLIYQVELPLELVGETTVWLTVCQLSPIVVLVCSSTNFHNWWEPMGANHSAVLAAASLLPCAWCVPGLKDVAFQGQCPLPRSFYS